MHYLRVFLYIFSLHLLVACGGGDGDSSSFDELSISDEDFDQYTGVITAADLDAGLMDLYTSAVLSNSFEFPTDYSNNDVSIVSFGSATVRRKSSNSDEISSSNSDSISINETENCQDGGSVRVRGKINEDLTGILEVEYSQCIESGSIYNGNVSVEVLDGSDSDYEAVSYFKRLLITQGDSSTRMSGRQHRIDSNYGGTTELISDLVLINTNTESQVKFENYRTKTSCTRCTYATNDTFEGRIYHSEHGYLDVSTPTPLNDVGFSSNIGLVGQLSFLSSSGQTLLVTFENKEVYKNSTVNHKLHSVRVQFDGDSDGLFERDTLFPFELAFEFEIYDIADSDGDGMTDGWERLFGFNPTSDDAEIDSDLDGYSNLEEFLYGGNPLSDSVPPLVTDLSIELSEYYDLVRGGRPQNIYVTVNNPNPVYGANDLEIVVTKNSDIEWEDYDRDGWTYLNDNQISRTLEYLSQDFARAVSIKILGEPGKYSLSASVSSRTTDTNLSNNRNSLTSSFAPRETNLGVIANTYLIRGGFSNYDSAAIDYEHSFQIALTQWGPDDAKNAVFRMSLPQHVEVLSASYYLRDYSSGDCTVSEEIRCDLGSFFHNAGSYQGHIQVDVKGISEGMGEYTATITSDSIDPDPENNQITKEIFVGQSLKPIQDQIDAADGPIEINLAAGMYVGGLNFYNLGVTLNGSGEQGDTLIRTSSPVRGLSDLFNLGSNSTIRNIRFFGREARTYSVPAIRIGGENILIEQNIFEHNGYNVVGVDADWAQNLTISGNIFRGSKANGSLCHVIGLDGPGPFRVENNLIHDTECTAIMMFKSFYSPGDTLNSEIINNTIIDNEVGISDLAEFEFGSFQINNNIVVGNQTGIAINNVYSNPFEEHSVSMPNIGNNLFFNNGEDISISPYLDLEFSDDGTNLYQDPLFSDTTVDNYELGVESPAIDTGSNTYAPENDLNEALRPIDGNGDGISQVDIGAFERQN